MSATITTLPGFSGIGGNSRIASYSTWLYVMTSNGVVQSDFSGNVINSSWYTQQNYQAICIASNYMFVVGGNGARGITRITINSDGTRGEINRDFFSVSSPGAGSAPDIEYITSYENRIIFGSSGGLGSFTINPLDGSYVSYKTIVGYPGAGGIGFVVVVNNIVYVLANQLVTFNLNTDVFSWEPSVNWASKGIGGGAYCPVVYQSNIYICAKNTGDTSYYIYKLDLSFNIIDKYSSALPNYVRWVSLVNNSLYAVDGAGNYILNISLPPPPPTYLYSKIQINYTSIVNGNPIGGKVFEGYYKYQVSNSEIKEFYSSTDMSTNLIISSTDSFATGALALLGKTSCNVVTSNGINTSGNNAGIFVKDLPFINALFKSNPYVLLNPSGCVMFDNYGLVNANILNTSYFTNKYVMSNGIVYSNKNNSFFSFSNFTFNFSSISALPTVSVPSAIDYTFFNSIKQIKYNAKYNGAVLLDSYFVFYLDSSNNYHMCAQYPTTENKNVLLFSDSACDNFPNTGNFGNTLGTVNPNPTVSTIVAVSGNAATATVTTSTVSVTGTSTVSSSVSATGTVARVNLNALNSNICFSEGSIVSTDQGEVEIQNINKHYHTIRGNKIIALTETQSVDDYLVKINKNAFGNVPTQDTEMTGNHMIFNGLSMVRAKTLINGTSIIKIPYRGLPLYNILLDKHDIMMVNGLACETLNPENPIAKYYMLMAEHPENKIEMENMWRKRTQEIIHSF